MIPEIIYQFPAADNDEAKNYQNIIKQTVFPFGVETSLRKKSSSFSEINEIVYSGLLPDKFGNVFVLTFKTESSFLNQTQKDKYLQLANPNNLYYCICMQQKEFFLVQNSKHYITTYKTYVIITHFPFIHFFVDLLQSLIRIFVIHL
jgi:hypothetical protein